VRPSGLQEEAVRLAVEAEDRVIAWLEDRSLVIAWAFRSDCEFEGSQATAKVYAVVDREKERTKLLVGRSLSTAIDWTRRIV